MAAIESLIEGSEKLTRVFGCWPSFHDAEIVELHLWRGAVDPDRERYVFPVLTVTLKVWELTQETDAQGLLISSHHTLATLRFHDLDETLKLDGFNHRNAILELLITHHRRTDGPSPYFDVRFVSSFGMGASFRCCRVEVIEAVPCGERDNSHAEPGSAPNSGASTQRGSSGITEGPPLMS